MSGKFLGPLSIVFLGGLGLFSLGNAEISKALKDGFEDGVTQHKLEGAFDDAIVARSASISGWGAFNAFLFREASPGALLGKGGWLFTDEEYQSPPDFGERLQNSIQKITSTADQISASGSKLIVVLLPDKARIMSDLAPGSRSQNTKDRYDKTLQELTDAGVNVVDPRSTMSALVGTETPPFLKNDTHWSVSGALAVAEVAAPLVEDAVAERAEFTLEVQPAELREGDLEKFLSTGYFKNWLGPEPETAKSVTAVSSGESTDLFGDSAPVAALVGTSYSAKEKLGFLYDLMAKSSTDILNFSKEGQGPFKPMTDFLEENDVSSFSVVIWEIPERYLTLNSEQDK